MHSFSVKTFFSFVLVIATTVHAYSQTPIGSCDGCVYEGKSHNIKGPIVNLKGGDSKVIEFKNPCLERRSIDFPDTDISYDFSFAKGKEGAAVGMNCTSAKRYKDDSGFEKIIGIYWMVSNKGNFYFLATKEGLWLDIKNYKSINCKNFIPLGSNKMRVLKNSQDWFFMVNGDTVYRYTQPFEAPLHRLSGNFIVYLKQKSSFTNFSMKMYADNKKDDLLTAKMAQYNGRYIVSSKVCKERGEFPIDVTIFGKNGTIIMNISGLGTETIKYLKLVQESDGSSYYVPETKGQDPRDDFQSPSGNLKGVSVSMPGKVAMMIQSMSLSLEQNKPVIGFDLYQESNGKDVYEKSTHTYKYDKVKCYFLGKIQ